MKNLYSIVSSVSLFLLSFYVVAQPNADKLTITPLTGDFYIYTTYQMYKGTPFAANAMYLITEEGAVLIDSPWDTTQLQPLFDSIYAKHGKKVIMSIATHSHEDRTGGLDFLQSKGVKTYTTKLTDEILQSENEKRAEFVIDKDTTFTIGNYSFQTFYAGEGHTPDNIVVWFPKDRVLYGGCLVKSIEATDLGNLADANVTAWPATIKKIQQHFKKPNYVIPGHQAWTSTKALDHTLLLIRAHEKKK